MIDIPQQTSTSLMEERLRTAVPHASRRTGHRFYSERFRQAVAVAVACTAPVAGQLVDETDSTFYRNYGEQVYWQQRHERDVVGLYDEFGEHITDGVNVYTLANSRLSLSLSDREKSRADSILYSTSNETNKAEFYEQFANLVLTQDRAGKLGTTFLIGNQIATRFTPLTFNKINFSGLRWDLDAPNLELSFLLSRTRPTASAMYATDQSSLVEYPTTESSFSSSYYNRGIRGDRDMSTTSPYGDYEWLWACHARTELFKRVDLGLTYINHHVSDIKHNEEWVRGNIPDGWLPGEVHFEFYDLTPEDTLDAGVYVHDVRMRINGRLVRASPAHIGDFRLALLGDNDLVLRPSMLPLPRPHDGPTPVVVAFALQPEFWVFEDGTTLGALDDIQRISFEYTVAGNYLTFVSTDRQIPLCIAGEPNDLTGEIEYRLPQKSIRSIYNAGLDASDDGEYDWPNREQDYATTYFGDYISKAPHPISVSSPAFAQAVSNGDIFARKASYNCRTHTYRYDIPVSSVTYGIDFAGELFGVSFNGELAVNRREDMLPGSEESRTTDTRLTGALHASRAFGKRFDVDASLYSIAPGWRTSLDNMQPSRYYRYTSYSTTESRTSRAYPDYLKHPTPFDNGWNNIDDNDDNDGYVESDRRPYPSDLDGNGDRALFYDDGTLRWNNDEIRTVELPTGLSTSYDDPDGTINSRHDRNVNGAPDYLEDFLLFYSDDPVFYLGHDRNNNGIADWEDDDMQPDYGYSVGSVLTSDGVKHQGIRGLQLQVSYTPAEGTAVVVGGTAEGVRDRDLVFDESAEGEHNLDDSEGRSYMAFARISREHRSTDRTLSYSIANELRAVQDGIRNDAIGYASSSVDDDLVVNYTYETDPMRYRRVVVDELVGDLSYSGVENLDYGLRLKLSAEKSLGFCNGATEDGTFYVTRTLRNPVNGDVTYASQWETYADRLVGQAHLAARASYRMDFSMDYQDWRRVLRPLNRLQITPQYKFSLTYSDEISGPTMEDPRDVAQYAAWFDDRDPTLGDSVLTVEQREQVNDVRTAWQEHTYYNRAHILSVPIVRIDYRLFENTSLQMGVQFKRFRDLQSPENSSLSTVLLGQLRARTMYHGYSVGFIIGARYRHTRYDVNTYDPVLQLGHPHDVTDMRIFANLYSGA